MKGLLLKDFYLAWTHFKSYILILILFAALAVMDNGMYFVFYPCMICGMLPVNLMSYDERSKWDLYSALLPVERSKIVASKYIVGLLFQSVMIVISLVSCTVQMLYSGGINWPELFTVMGMLMLLSAVSTAVPLPFIFKMGVEKGRMGYYIMIGIACGGSTFLAGWLGDRTSVEFLPGFAFPILALSAAAVYAFSWYLSVEFYKKREL